MSLRRLNAYDATFKLKAIVLGFKEGNGAAARKFDINESMTTKDFIGKKSIWPELENVFEDWENKQRADGRGVSTVQIQLKDKTISAKKNIEEFTSGPSWCFRFIQMKGLSVRAYTTTIQLPSDLKEKTTNFSKFTENSIGPENIINTNEIPLPFDLPLTGTVNKKGE
uniref:HTH CENPB-type domain-containing protein n=1 Tax=Denticeps clupeoides TaxID=299321 RepID=A0AAY4D6J5_9TELE